MIRTRTDKGSPRRLPARLGAGLLLAALLPGPARPGPQRDADWWEIRLSVAVQGTYSLRGEGAPLSGEYSGRLLWEGRLEPDGYDFILVRLRSEVLEWSHREKAVEDGAESVLEAPETARPALRLNYVLREHGEVTFDFEIEGTSAPLHGRPIEVPLEMPRSARPPGITPGYRDYVLSGSNRIVLPASDLKRRRPQRTFAWTWRRVDSLGKGPRAFVAIQGHSAEAVVALTRR